jgi:hypothetical protein
VADSLRNFSNRRTVTLLTFPDEQNAYDEFIQRFGDGLPLVLPTRERVDALLAGVQRDPEEVLGPIMPSGAIARVRDVAINAVMAGLPKAAFGIALTAVEAAMDPAFNLNGVQSTTHHAAALIIVSGPGAERAGMNAGTNAFGQGNRANSTIGRTLRLVMMNIGRGIPGKTDMSVQGSPAKAGFCYPERLDALPWPSLAERQTGKSDATTVTLYAGESPHMISDHRSASAEHLLGNFADAMRVLGSTNSCRPSYMVVAFCPQHASLLSGFGYGVAEIQRFLFEGARNSIKRLEDSGEFEARLMGRIAAPYGSPDDPETRVPVFRKPEDLIVTVVGGLSGGFSSVIPAWPSNQPVFKEVITHD